MKKKDLAIFFSFKLTCMSVKVCVWREGVGGKKGGDGRGKEGEGMVRDNGLWQGKQLHCTCTAMQASLPLPPYVGLVLPPTQNKCQRYPSLPISCVQHCFHLCTSQVFGTCTDEEDGFLITTAGCAKNILINILLPLPDLLPIFQNI
jgi:hypothetical protein